MADLQDFQPLKTENVLTIRARVDSDINAGVDPSDSAFLDTTEGTVVWDMTQGLVLEFDRLWDFVASEAVAAAFPAFAWGEYLDYHGDTLNLLRKDEVASTGAIYLSGQPGTPIPTGIQVATVRPNPDADPIAFATTQAVTLAESPGPTGLGATPSGTGGTLPAATYWYEVTAIAADGFETVVSNEVVATVSGATSKVTLVWSAYTGATGYRVYRGVASGAETLLVSVAAGTLTYVDTGAVTPGGTIPPTNLVPIVALVAGAGGNVSAGAITQLVSPQAGVTAVTNPAPTSGGADVESDDLYRGRILLEFSTAQGAGNAGDYQRWALAYDPIGFATIEPLWAGPGTVRVIVTDQQNNPVSTIVTTGLQTQLDPTPGLGGGLAPIGAIVTVATPSITAINPAATLVLDAGYSLDGTGGTIAVRGDVVQSLSEYIDALRPGDDVILEHAKARLFAVTGVHDVSGVTLNGSAANVVLDSLHVAQLGSVTLA